MNLNIRMFGILSRCMVINLNLPSSRVSVLLLLRHATISHPESQMNIRTGTAERVL